MPADLFIILNGGTFIMAVVMGVVCGALFFRDGRITLIMLIILYTLGLAFLAAIGTTRWFENVPSWSAWVGTCILWSVFVGTIALRPLGKAIWRRNARKKA